MENIILNIGIQSTVATQDIKECSVRLSRIPTPDSAEEYNIEDEGYEEEALEALAQPLISETWQSGNAATSVECLCLALEIDPAWEGEVLLEVETALGKFLANVHLHKGLNSFYLAADRMLPLQSDNKKSKTVLAVILSVVAVACVAFAIWAIVKALSGDSQPAPQDSVIDSVVESTAVVESVTVDTTPVPQSPTQDYSYSPAYSYSDYSYSSSDSSDADNQSAVAEPPRKEKTYGIAD